MRNQKNQNRNYFSQVELFLATVALNTLFKVIIKRKKISNNSNSSIQIYDCTVYEQHIYVNSTDIPLVDQSKIDIVNKLGSGQFGEVFHGVYNSAEIAIKVNFHLI